MGPREVFTQSLLGPTMSTESEAQHRSAARFLSPLPRRHPLPCSTRVKPEDPNSHSKPNARLGNQHDHVGPPAPSATSEGPGLSSRAQQRSGPGLSAGHRGTWAYHPPRLQLDSTSVRRCHEQGQDKDPQPRTASRIRCHLAKTYGAQQVGAESWGQAQPTTGKLKAQVTGHSHRGSGDRR